MRIRPSVVAAFLVVAVVLLGGVNGTMAAFSDSANVTAGPPASANAAFSTGGVATPVISSSAQVPTTAAVTVTWPATAVGTNGAVASAYEVYRFANATGADGNLACSTTGALTCTDTSAPQTTVYYELRAKFAGNWFKNSARVAYSPDVSAPTVTISTPVMNCPGSIVACGTSADSGGGTVATVEYTLRRLRTPFLGAGTYTCWNGSGYQSSVGGACPTFLPATGTTSWTVPGFDQTAYPLPPFLGSQSFLLTIRATDIFGNASTTSASFSN